MHPYHFSFDGSHPGLGVKEKCVVSASYVLVGCSCRAAASFNKTLQLTAQSAAALWVPSAAFGRSGGN
jgi:hypothetical protein